MTSSRVLASVLVSMALVAGCAGDAGSTCVEPPPDELAAASNIDLSVEPNPVVAGAAASLDVGSDSLPEDASTGAGASWQCWDGSTWLTTHQVVRGFDGGAGRTIDVQPGDTTTIPAVGLPIPSSHAIVIPQVPAGTYRIIDAVSVGGSTFTGFVFVEVLDG